MSECWNESNDREHIRLLPCLSWHASIQDCDCTSGLINILKELAWHIFNLVLSVQQVVRLWSLARPPQRSAWRCPHRQSYGTPSPPSHPPTPTPSAVWPRVRMKRMPARKAAAETLHWSSQMRRRYMLTQPLWVSQKLSRSKAQTTATPRPPSGHGWQTHSFKFLDENLFYIKAKTEGVLKTGLMFA